MGCFAPEGSGAKIVVVCSPKWMNKKFAFVITKPTVKPLVLRAFFFLRIIFK